MKKILIIIGLIAIILLIFGCTSNDNNQTTNNNQQIITQNKEVTSNIDQRIPSFSCISKTVTDVEWHCAQIFTDTPKDTSDWWQENCEKLGAGARTLTNTPCKVEGYRCMTPNNWTAEYYYEVGTEIVDDIKNNCEKIE